MKQTKFDIERLTSGGSSKKIVNVPGIHGICVFVYRGGRKVFSLQQYNSHKNTSTYTHIGAYPVYTLEMAAAKAVEIKRALALGKKYVPDNLKFVDVLQAAIKKPYSS